MPKNFQQITAFPPEDVKIAGVWVTMQRLLNLQGKTVHPTPHVRRARRQPDPYTRWRRNHLRSAVTTRRSATRLTSCPTVIAVPSGSLISILSTLFRSVSD